MADYVVITPVRNEAQHFPHTIASMVGQTLRPLRWVIVDDGSSDGTGVLADQAARAYDWIQAVHRPDRGGRRPGAGVIEAFYAGFTQLGATNWEFIVKLDGDLGFEPYYFDRLLTQFRRNPRLGIASGVYCERAHNGQWAEVKMPSYHAAGACKVIRRACWDQIGGFVTGLGWDTVDEIRAINKGWTTAHFPELKMLHHKREGSGIGLLRTNIMLGEIYYLTGGGWCFFTLKLLRRCVQWPPLVGSGAMLLGCVRAAAFRRPRLVSPSEACAYRRLLRERIRGAVLGPFAV